MSRDDNTVHEEQPAEQENVSEATRLEQQIRDWLQEHHADELAELPDRAPSEMWIRLSVATLEEECGADLREDVVHNTLIVEEGSNEFCGIKPVIVDLTNLEVEPAKITIRWTDVPDRRSVGQYRSQETERLMAVEGQIDQASGVAPVVSEAAFECARCGALSVIPQSITSEDLVEPMECSGCERQGPFNLNREQSEFVDFQELRLQTPPEQAQDGVDNVRVLVSGALAGEYSGELGRNAVVNGYLTTENNGDWKRPFLLQARDIELVDEVDVDIDTYREEIDRFERMDDPLPEIVDSKMLPDMYAPADSNLGRLEFAVLLQACSPPRLANSTRGDIHLFACGDPSTGKTAVAELAAEIVPRSEFVSTRATGVGLTAAGVHDEMTGWTIKAGAIVRANNGLLVIDELDKIEESDVNDLHNPMEGQRVSAAVADQSVTLPAETSVLATANPKYGRFDQYEPIGEQLDFPSSLLSRFDLIVTITDVIEEERDTQLAEAITDGFQEAIERERSKDAQQPSEDEVGFLRAWVTEAQNYLPKISSESKCRLEEFFVELRASISEENSAVPITARQLEGLNRLAVASARARHSEVVEEVDVNRAILLVKQSLKDASVDMEKGQFDADVIETGSSKAQSDRMRSLEQVVHDLGQEYDRGAPYDDIVEKMIERGFEKEKVEQTIEKAQEGGYIYEVDSDVLRTT